MKTSFLLTIICLFCCNFCFSAEGFTAPFKKVTYTPSETIALQFDEVDQWKQISKYTDENDAFVEFVPMDQTKKNWSQLVAIQFFSNSDTEPPLIETIVFSILNAFKEERSQNVTMKIINKNETDILFEWISIDFQGNPCGYNLAKIFLTKRGSHRIEFIKKGGMLTDKEKEKWIQLFNESTFPCSIKKAQELHCLSLTNRLKNKVKLGPVFDNWSIKENFFYNNGSTCIVRYPEDPSMNLITYLNPTAIEPTIDKWLTAEKEKLKNPTFKVLKKDSHDAIYSYMENNDETRVVYVVKGHLSDKGHYSFNLQQVLKDPLQKVEIEKWMDCLDKCGI